MSFQVQFILLQGLFGLCDTLQLSVASSHKAHLNTFTHIYIKHPLFFFVFLCIFIYFFYTHKFWVRNELEEMNIFLLLSHLHVWVGLFVQHIYTGFEYDLIRIVRNKHGNCSSYSSAKKKKKKRIVCVCTGGWRGWCNKKKIHGGVGEGDVIKIHGSFLTNTNHNVGPFFFLL